MRNRPAKNRSLWPRRAAFLAVVAGALAFSYFWGGRVEPAPAPLTAARLAALVGAAEAPVKKSGAYPYWVIRRGDEVLYAAESADLAPDVVGYGGPFDLLVVVDNRGNFDRMVLIRHNETPSYVADAGRFLASFVGLPAGKDLKVGRDVDAITRATISSEAFTAAASLGGRKLLKAALGREVELPAGENKVDWPWALAAVAFFGAALWARRGRPEYVRVVWLAAVVGVWGFWAGRFVSVGDIGRLAIFKFPPPAARLSLYVLLAGGAASALAVGNVYCGWLCPFGAASELLYKIPTRKLAAAPRFARRLGVVRFAALCAALAVVIATRKIDVAAYEPFDDLFAFAAAGWSLLFVVAVLAISVFHERFFCRYLCAAGAALGEVAALRGRRAPATCRNCGECAAACPTAAIDGNRGELERVLCVECGRCRRVCEAEDEGR